MTSFYDRTASVADWCERQRVPPADALAFLRERMLQVREYIDVVAPRLPWLDWRAPHTCATLAGADWKAFCKFARSLGVPVEGEGFWDVIFGVLDVVKSLGHTAEQFYDQLPMGFAETEWEVLCKPVGILHDVGHEIARRSRYSDSPLPPARHRSKVRNSDKWLKEHFPAAPKF